MKERNHLKNEMKITSRYVLNMKDIKQFISFFHSIRQKKRFNKGIHCCANQTYCAAQYDIKIEILKKEMNTFVIFFSALLLGKIIFFEILSMI